MSTPGDDADVPPDARTATVTISRGGAAMGTVTAEGAALSCAEPCTATVAIGTILTLVATPDPGAVFGGWTGGCAGTEPSCRFPVREDVAITATFGLPPALPLRALEIVRAGDGRGTVTSTPEGIACGADCTASYTDGTRVVLSATPAAGSVFSGWSGACAGIATCELTMTADATATGTFATVGTRIAVTNSNPPASISVFEVTAGNDAVPIARITGPATTLSSLRAITVANNEIYVADRTAKAVAVFLASANGNVAPIRRLIGPATGLSDIGGIAVFGGEIYVGQFNGPIQVYPQDATGNVAPTRTITGIGAGSYFAIDNGEIYATDRNPLRIVVFPAATSGAIVPTRTIAGASTGLSRPVAILVQGGEIFVSENADNTLRVFPQLASGNVAPRRVLSGINTLFDVPEQMAVLAGELYVANLGSTSVLVFPVNARGNVSPIRQIVGPSTGLSGPLGAWIF
ncbi:MAG: hypothetical protein H7138_00950 [Myxococcales bacterium]|nr:hypothetical protein [Myxococcales bacterium]